MRQTKIEQPQAAVLKSQQLQGRRILLRGRDKCALSQNSDRAHLYTT